MNHAHTHTSHCCPAVAREHRFTCRAASVSAVEIEPGVWHVEYAGLMFQSCLNFLRAKEVEATKEARVLFIRMDKVYMVTSHMPSVHCGHERINMAPATMIVRPDQYAKWANYATKMAQIGIMRAIFLPSQVAQALRMVDRLSGATVRQALSGQRQYDQS